MMKRPASAGGRRRPVCEYARKAALSSGNFRYKVDIPVFHLSNEVFGCKHSYNSTDTHFIRCEVMV